ncbi:MAG: hypothetical protein ACI9VR_004286 [Cognaticolwellia sp.]|jgi:hypothetical protein
MSRTSSAWLGVVLLTLALHLAYLSQDSRLPADLGQYYVPLPDLYRALNGESWQGVWPALMERPGAWYNLLTATWLSLVDKSAAAFQMLDLLWFGGLLFIGSSVGFVLGGERGRLAAATVLCATPMVVLSARTSWVHVPEATLLLAMLRIWLGDPTLSKRRSVFGLALLGALCLSLRPSALPWLATFLGAALWGVDGKRPSWKKLVWIVVTWALASIQMLPYIETYLAAKAMARSRYMERVPELLTQLIGAVGVLGGLASVVGAILGLRKPDGLYALAWVFVLLPLLLTTLSGAGLDNFLPLAIGLALMAARNTDRHPWSVGLWALPLLVLVSPQLLTDLPKDGVLHKAFGLLQTPANPGPNNRLRPFQELAGDELFSLIEASCPDPRAPCTLLIDQGLFEPYGESMGELPLFLTWERRTELVSLAQGDLPTQINPDAMVHWSCTEEKAEEERIWRNRYPQSGRKAMELSERFDLRLAWKRDLRGCSLMWLTPGGNVGTPEQLPFPGPVLDNEHHLLELSVVSESPRDRPRPQVPGR